MKPTFKTFIRSTLLPGVFFHNGSIHI